MFKFNGYIPEGWKAIHLIELADKKIRHSFTGGPFGSNLKAEHYTERGIRVIQLQNIGEGEFLNDYKIYTSIKKANELQSCNIYPGEILISKMGDPVARALIVPNHEDRYVMCSDGIRLVVDKTHFNPYYVVEYLNSFEFRKTAIRHGTGSTRQRIGLSDLKKLPVLVPPLNEQNRIAKLLRATDAEISLMEKRISALKARKIGVKQKLYSGQWRL